MDLVTICSLRAETLRGKLYEFTVADIPVIVSDSTFVLLNRRFSPILKYNTIAFGSDVGVYVGDVLLDEDGEEWFVKYVCGFYATSRDGSKRKMLYEFETLNVVRQASAEEREALNIVTIKIKFKHRGYVFVLPDIVGKYNGNLILKSFPDRANPNPLETQQSVSASINGKALYLGDLYKRMPIIMCYGRICIQTDLGAYDIFENRYIIRK